MAFYGKFSTLLEVMALKHNFECVSNFFSQRHQKELCQRQFEAERQFNNAYVRFWRTSKGSAIRNAFHENTREGLRMKGKAAAQERPSRQ
jgi:hypothetical protein